MPQESSDKKKATDNFAEMFHSFGDALAQIFDDPKLKEQAKEFGKTAADSAKVFASRFKDEDVKKKFREAGKAAEEFGKSVKESFKEKRKKE
jgi:[ribosomal protein S5]-alanine N-acetyltransferase